MVCSENYYSISTKNKIQFPHPIRFELRFKSSKKLQKILKFHILEQFLTENQISEQFEECVNCKHIEFVVIFEETDAFDGDSSMIGATDWVGEELE